jgi:hypothetical protein
MQNSLWSHDYYPELPDLHANATLEIGRFDGPGMIRTMHLTLNIEGNSRAELLRNVFLMITYNGVTQLACFRFLLNDPIRFAKSVRARINYQYELKNIPLQKAKAKGNGLVRFGIVTYWYQQQPVNAAGV